MLRVYLSSTFSDLKAFRRAAKDTILASGFDCSAMEDYGASSDQPRDYCLQDVEQCDLYVGLFAFRYGYVPQGERKSITHQEYDHARGSKLDTLIFLADEKSVWPAEACDPSPRAAITTLRTRLSLDHKVKFFSTPADLASLVASSLARYLQESPGRKATVLREAAAQAFARGDWGDARKQLEQLVQLDPKSAVGWYYLAIAQFDGKSPGSASLARVRVAEQHGQRARVLSPNDGHAALLLAVIRRSYYHRHGLKPPPPSLDDLLWAAQDTGLNAERVRELYRLLAFDGNFR